MSTDKMLAMILAGGRGSRLEDLTLKMAKPAVYYGGKYRIIDFPISNCANSGITKVGILTQYESVLLNWYASDASRYGLDGVDSGIYMLPPREKIKGLDFYVATADAIYQNIDFISSSNCPYTLVLSGDHIYKMNYSKMLNAHINQEADLTIAVLEVDYEEAKRFGIMNCDEHNNILEFEEKPAQPKSTKASMGIYIFKSDVLIKLLKEDHEDQTSQHDFGKNIIPKMLEEGYKLQAYDFNGYWKDVGTIDSLWEANMDLLSHNPNFNLFDDYWKIYTEDVIAPPHFIGSSGKVTNSLINQGCIIEGEVTNCVIFKGVHIKKGSKLKDCVVFPDVIIEENITINKALIEDKQVIDTDYLNEDNKVLLLARGA